MAHFHPMTLKAQLTDDDREALTRLLDDFPSTFDQPNPVESKYLATFNPWRMRVFPMNEGKVKQFAYHEPLSITVPAASSAVTPALDSYVAEFEHYTFKKGTEKGWSKSTESVQIDVGLAYDYVLEATLLMVPPGWRLIIEDIAPLVGHQRKHYMEIMKFAALGLLDSAVSGIQISYPPDQKFVFMGTEIMWDIYSRRQLQEAHDILDQSGAKSGILHLKEIRDARLSF